MKSIFHNYKCSLLEILLLLCSFILLGWAILSQIKGTGWSVWFETNSLDHIGSFMGGLFSIISIYYLAKILLSNVKSPPYNLSKAITWKLLSFAEIK